MAGGGGSYSSSISSIGSSSRRQLVIRQFFELLERQYGGNVPFEPTSTQVVQQSTLTSSALVDLVQHKCIALHIPQFISPTTAIRLGQELEWEQQNHHQQHHHNTTTTTAANWRVATSRGLESSDVTTAGAHRPYNTVQTETDREEYFNGVVRELQQRRRTRQRRPPFIIDPSSASTLAAAAGCSSTTATTTDKDDDLHRSIAREEEEVGEVVERLWPLDLLRLQLDETWTPGCGLAKEAKTGRPFGGGLPRIMEGPTRWKYGHIHVDEMGPLQHHRGLFSANIYLQLPKHDDDDENDGENQSTTTHHHQRRPCCETLHIWPTAIYSRWDWYRNAILWSGLATQDPDAQARLRNELGAPHTITAAPGDLVLLCVQRPHAAVGFRMGTRISLQCFIQFDGLHQRLLIDC